MTKLHALSSLFLTLPALILAVSVGAQEALDELARVRATAEAALKAISDEDMIAFTDLILEEASLFSIADRDGEVRYSFRSRAETRSQKPENDILERGFDPKIHVTDSVAIVWLPYDMYINGVWSHCGIDTFAMVQTSAGWRIASMGWSVEQPPNCQPHPDGPPGS